MKILATHRKGATSLLALSLAALMPAPVLGEVEVVVASVVTMFAVIGLLVFKTAFNEDLKEEVPGPDYLGADLHIGDFDDNGHYIGDSKSSN